LSWKEKAPGGAKEERKPEKTAGNRRKPLNLCLHFIKSYDMIRKL
jgi:hypothetical protein